MRDDRDLTAAEPASAPDQPRFVRGVYRNFAALVELTYTPRFLIGKRTPASQDSTSDSESQNPG